MLCVVMLMSFAAQPKPARRCVGYGCVHALYFVLLRWNGVPESTALFFVVEMYVGGKQEIVKGKEVLGGLCELWLLSGSTFFMTYRNRPQTRQGVPFFTSQGARLQGDSHAGTASQRGRCFVLGASKHLCPYFLFDLSILRKGHMCRDLSSLGTYALSSISLSFSRIKEWR